MVASEPGLVEGRPIHVRNMPEAHRQAVIKVLGEMRLRPFGLDEVQKVISEFSFVGRC
jgi:hypothetical protein